MKNNNTIILLFVTLAVSVVLLLFAFLSLMNPKTNPDIDTTRQSVPSQEAPDEVEIPTEEMTLPE